MKTHSTSSRPVILARGAALLTCGFAMALAPSAFAQGSLTPPPGGPAPTMHTLEQLATKLDLIDTKAEKRTPITALPFAITAPGSYYLAGTLTGTSGQNGITISANDVTIDLNGFALLGVAGAKVGIDINPAVSGVAVTNGTVRGWPTGNIIGENGPNNTPPTGCRFSHLHLVGSADRGLATGFSAVVTDCIAEGNTGGGISVGLGSTVSHCTASGSGGYAGFSTYVVTQNGGGLYGPSVFTGCNASGNTYGFFVAGSVLTDCSTTENTSGGYYVSGQSALHSCVAFKDKDSGFTLVASLAEACNAVGNGSNGNGSGFRASNASSLTNCVADNNMLHGIALFTSSAATGCNASFNGTDGINASLACNIAHNNCADNQGAGVHLTGGDNRVQDNKVNDNNTGIRADAAVNLIFGNSARANSGTNGGNFIIAAGNRVGTIVVPPVSGAINGNSGGAGLGSTDSSANIAY